MLAIKTPERYPLLILSMLLTPYSSVSIANLNKQMFTRLVFETPLCYWAYRHFSNLGRPLINAD